MSTTAGTILTYYDYLGVQPSASEEDIDRAYRKLAQKAHPDKNRNDQKAATAQFQVLGAIHSILTDAKTRELYDFNLLLGKLGFDEEVREKLVHKFALYVPAMSALFNEHLQCLQSVNRKLLFFVLFHTQTLQGIKDLVQYAPALSALSETVMLDHMCQRLGNISKGLEELHEMARRSPTAGAASIQSPESMQRSEAPSVTKESNISVTPKGIPVIPRARRPNPGVPFAPVVAKSEQDALENFKSCLASLQFDPEHISIICSNIKETHYKALTKVIQKNLGALQELVEENPNFLYWLFTTPSILIYPSKLAGSLELLAQNYSPLIKVGYTKENIVAKVKEVCRRSLGDLPSEVNKLFQEKWASSSHPAGPSPIPANTNTKRKVDFDAPSDLHRNSHSVVKQNGPLDTFELILSELHFSEEERLQIVQCNSNDIPQISAKLQTHVRSLQSLDKRLLFHILTNRKNSNSIDALSLHGPTIAKYLSPEEIIEVMRGRGMKLDETLSQLADVLSSQGDIQLPEAPVSTKFSQSVKPQGVAEPDGSNPAGLSPMSSDTNKRKADFEIPLAKRGASFFAENEVLPRASSQCSLTL